MSAQHTPGPWRFEPDFHEVQAGGPSDYCIVARLAVGDGDYHPSQTLQSEEVRTANGYLLAAAPAMKVILEKLLDTALPASSLRVPPYLVEAIKDVLREAQR